MLGADDFQPWWFESLRVQNNEMLGQDFQGSVSFDIPRFESAGETESSLDSS